MKINKNTDFVALSCIIGRSFFRRIQCATFLLHLLRKKTFANLYCNQGQQSVFYESEEFCFTYYCPTNETDSGWCMCGGVLPSNSTCKCACSSSFCDSSKEFSCSPHWPYQSCTVPANLTHIIKPVTPT